MVKHYAVNHAYRLLGYIEKSDKVKYVFSPEHILIYFIAIDIEKDESNVRN